MSKTRRISPQIEYREKDDALLEEVFGHVLTDEELIEEINNPKGDMLGVMDLFHKYLTCKDRELIEKIADSNEFRKKEENYEEYKQEFIHFLMNINLVDIESLHRNYLEGYFLWHIYLYAADGYVIRLSEKAEGELRAKPELNNDQKDILRENYRLDTLFKERVEIRKFLNFELCTLPQDTQKELDHYNAIYQAKKSKEDQLNSYIYEIKQLIESMHIANQKEREINLLDIAYHRGLEFELSPLAIDRLLRWHYKENEPERKYIKNYLFKYLESGYFSPEILNELNGICGNFLHYMGYNSVIMDPKKMELLVKLKGEKWLSEKLNEKNLADETVYQAINRLYGIFPDYYNPLLGDGKKEDKISMASCLFYGGNDEIEKRGNAIGEELYEFASFRGLFSTYSYYVEPDDREIADPSPYAPITTKYERYNNQKVSSYWQAVNEELADLILPSKEEWLKKQSEEKKDKAIKTTSVLAGAGALVGGVAAIITGHVIIGGLCLAGVAGAAFIFAKKIWNRTEEEIKKPLSTLEHRKELNIELDRQYKLAFKSCSYEKFERRWIEF